MQVSRSGAVARRAGCRRPGCRRRWCVATTMPGCSSTHSPMIAACRAERVRPHRGQHRVGLPRGARRPPACPRWPRTSGPARAARTRWRPRAAPGIDFSTSRTPTRDAAAISLSDVARPPRVGSRSTCRSGVDREHGRDQRVQRRAVGDHVGAELETLAHTHDRDAVHADRAADDDHVADLGAVRTDVDAVGDQADARGVDVDLVAVAGVDHLRVAGDDPRRRPCARPPPCPRRSARRPRARCLLRG